MVVGEAGAKIKVLAPMQLKIVIFDYRKGCIELV
jgi:hypothetical protein